MMGFRVGYLAYVEAHGLGEQLLKVQDTIPICPPQLSQLVALGAVQAGRAWVAPQLETILGNRCCSPCGPSAAGWTLADALLMEAFAFVLEMWANTASSQGW